MALALRLAEAGVEGERLSVTSAVTLDDVDGVPTVVSSALEVNAQIAGIDQAEFDTALAEAAELCPISRLFAGAQVTVHAELQRA
jgi:osmotically inducible protein OsmC